jgi:tetratricopeptide (TPR) repeat protein/GTPase SAR1 family protein
MADYGTVSSAVLGAVVHLVKACEGVSNAYDWIEQLFRELQDFSDRLGQYAQTRLDPVLRRKMIAILAVILKVMGRSQRLIRERRFKEYLRVTFLGKDAATKTLIDDLNTLLGSEQRYVLGVTYATTQRTEETVNSTHEIASKVLSVIEDEKDRKTQSEDESRLRNALCATSAPADVEEIFVRNERVLLRGTGAWLEEEPFFQAWMRREAVFLWIFGGPGSGKSFLSTRLIQKLREENDENDTVAFFFVKENSENLRDANILLKTLAWQIASQDATFRRHAIAVCRQRSLTITAELTWENLFLRYYRHDANGGLNTINATTIVIDGLDEATAETRMTILGLMKELVSTLQTSNNDVRGIRVAIIGRRSLRSDMDFKRQEKNYFIEVSRTKNQDDINSYIRKRLEELDILREMRKMKPNGLKRANKEGGKIMKKVAEGADGVFLWAKLLLDSLVKKDLPQIDAILASPPSTLDTMIWSVFDRLAKDEELDQHVLRKMLMFMTHARRPLLFGELDLVTSLPARKPNYLLWKHTHGTLSSVFDLKFPNDVDPDEVEVSGDEPEVEGDEKLGSTPGGTDSQTEDEGGFDFSYDDGESAEEDSEGGTMSDDDDIFSTTVERVRVNEGRSTEEGAEEVLEDLLSHLTTHKVHTKVAFCHTRIRDLLVREGNPKTRQSEPLSIIPGSEDAHVEITIACLEIFKLELSPKDDQRFLCDYPLCHLPFHLEGIDKESISPEKAGRVIDGLYWLFGTRKGALCFLKSVMDYDEFHNSNREFWALWAATDRYLRLVQSWLGSVSLFREFVSVSDIAATWMLKASESLEDLLRPAIHTASAEWLCRPNFESDTYFKKGEFPAWLINGWLTLVEGREPLPEPSAFVNFKTVTPERLEYTASYAGLKRDVHWHTLLGWTLMMGLHYDAAVLHYKIAIGLYPRAWVALEGLARCAGEQGQHAEAIAWQEQAIEVLPDKLHWIMGYLCPRITDWATQIGDTDKAYHHAREGFRADPTCTLAATTLLHELRKHENAAELMDVLKVLASTETRGLTYNALVRLFVRGEDVLWPIGWACAKMGRPAFVLHALDEAMTIVDSGDREWIKVWLPYTSAKFKCVFYGMEEQAVTLLETFLKRLAQKNEGLRRKYAVERMEARNMLARFYFDAAVEAWEKDPTTRPTSADNLKQLAVPVSTGFGDDYEGFDVFRADYPAMLWGRWLRDHRGADETVWRKCFRARLLEEMNTVDDDDPTNDTAGISSLAVSLFHAGDRRNAAAIMAILFRSLEPSKGGSEGSKDEEGDALKLNIEIATTFYCCCNCKKGIDRAAEMFICEICPNGIHWCGDCLMLLRDFQSQEKLTHRLCHPRHDVYQAWPIPEDAMHVAAGSFENGVTVRKEWLEKLRRDWWA